MSNTRTCKLLESLKLLGHTCSLATDSAICGVRLHVESAVGCVPSRALKASCVGRSVDVATAPCSATNTCRKSTSAVACAGRFVTLSMTLKRRPHRSIPRIPKSRRFDVSRDEFNRVIDLLNTRGEILQEYRSSLDQMRRDLDIQFKRIAQLQLELDQIRNRF